MSELVHFELNGTQLGFHKASGTLVSIVHPACGMIMRDGKCGIDVAWPAKFDYEILRAGARYHAHVRQADLPAAQYEYTGDILTVTIPKMPVSLAVPPMSCLDGGIEGRLTFKASPDGASIVMSCRVCNHSATPVRQVIFPDFDGLLPIAGQEGTRFTTLGFAKRPFLELADTPESRASFYSLVRAWGGEFYQSGGYWGQNMIGRWYDYGGLQGGFSLFRRWWGWGPDNMKQMGLGDVTWVKKNQKAGTLRIGSLHEVTLGQGESYESGAYVFTPHPGGWIHGIAPYRQWIDENKKRPVPQPQSVKEALGYRSIWMMEQYPEDPDAIKYRFDDLPRVADDMLAHGLSELVVWGYGGDLPYGESNTFEKHLGGGEAWARNVALCNKKGVNVLPFVSFVSIWRASAPRYGLEVESPDQGWAQNLKAVPAFRTPYLEKMRCRMIDQANKLWQSDVLASMRFLRDRAGTPSISWDQYLVANVPGNMDELVAQYRRETHAMFPDATFSGESSGYFEADVRHLDYTWNWKYVAGTGEFAIHDCRPYIHAAATTRPNINIDNNPLDVKYCFMDNIMMNIMPSRVEDINGSAYIAEHEELSDVLKRCAALRRRYLRYFTGGEMLGDCVLTSDAQGGRVTAYALDGGMLIVAMQSGNQGIKLAYDLQAWLPAGRYKAVVVDIDGRVVDTRPDFERAGSLHLKGANGELRLVEIAPC